MIYISTVSRRGFSHPDWNEDCYFIHQTGDSIIGGVFDGCSSGKDSYFASKLMANVFRLVVEKFTLPLNCKLLQTLSHSFVVQLFETVQNLGLKEEETLSTALLFCYELKTKHLFVKFFGDGVVYSNEEKLEKCLNDEQNQPDYVAYALNRLSDKNIFKTYWDQKSFFDRKTSDFTISTDGILSFKHPGAGLDELDPESYLVSDSFLFQNPAFLKRKLNILQSKGFRHEDDLTLIRVINDDQENYFKP